MKVFEKIDQFVDNFWKIDSHMHIAVGIVDFKSKTFECKNYSHERECDIFDLASLSKPFNSSLVRLKRPDLFDDQDLLLLNHRAGLPAWGRLSHQGWKDQILKYSIKKSDVLYSDYSALRLMLELEKKSGKRFQELVRKDHQDKLFFWKDLKSDQIEKSILTGYRNKKEVRGIVHDDNAYVIDEYVNHAGLFSTIENVCGFLLDLDKNYQLIEFMSEALVSKKSRFIEGFDTPGEEGKTLAGSGFSDKTFGHLGFTGTSFWVDINKRIGSVILSNAVYPYWYNRGRINQIRKNINSEIWRI